MSTLDQFISGVRHALWGPELRPLELFARKPENIFESGVTLKKVLPDEFQEVHGGYSPDYKKIEIHFYPDLGTTRTITAFVSKEDEDQVMPEGGKKVYFRLAPGSAPRAKLKSNEAETDSNGFASVEVEHPAETPPGLQTIFIQASLNEEFQGYAQVNLVVCRNQDVSEDLSQVLSGDTLLVCQNENHEKSAGVKRVQELLNQVVARKRSAREFKWLAHDGVYADRGKSVVKELLTKFSGDFDYEKGQFDVKVNERVKEYVKSEYGDYEDGMLVDRSLLIGEKLWSDSDPVKEIDGLLDIYNGVVRRFFDEMIRVSETYTGCDTFWLHRPIHKRYKAGKAFEVYPRENVSLRVGPTGESDIVKNESTGGNETVKKGEKYKVIDTQSSEVTRWHKVRAFPSLKSYTWIHEDNVEEEAGYKKLKFTRTAVLQNGTTSGRKAKIDYNGNEIKVGAGTEVKGTAKKKRDDGFWYALRLDSRIGWISADDSKLINGKKWASATKSTKVYIEPSEESDTLKDYAGNEISLSEGEKASYLKKTTPPGEPWYELERDDGVEGWVHSKKCRAITNDRPYAINAGTFGMPGEAYSFGCKDRPNEYNQLLKTNSLKPDDIKCWLQYEDRHKPGKSNKDDDTINWTGVDCSGFVQNCITDSLLWNNRRIVPESRLKKIVRKPVGEEGGWAYSATCVPARGFVFQYARKIPYEANDPEKDWLDITDLITSPGHIVWVREESPETVRNNRDFEVVNAYGSYIRRNAKPRLPRDKFLRKVVRMPFKYWGIYCGGDKIKLGRVYFWS